MPQQIVRAAAARIERRAGHREDVPALLECKSGGDQRTGASRGLDHHNAESHPGNEPVAAREMPRLRLGSERQFGDDRAPGAPTPRAARDFLRDRRHRPRRRRRRRCRSRARPDARRHRCRGPGPKRRRCRLVRAPRRGRGRSAGHWPRRCAPRPPPRSGCASNSGPPEHGQDRRRVVDRREPARVGWLAPADEPRPETVQCGELGFGLGAGDRGHGLGALAAPRELRDHFQRRAGGAEAAQQRVKADRADGLGAAQPQPVEALLRIEFACGQCLASAFTERDPALRASQQPADIRMVPRDD